MIAGPAALASLIAPPLPRRSGSEVELAVAGVRALVGETTSPPPQAAASRAPGRPVGAPRLAIGAGDSPEDRSGSGVAADQRPAPALNPRYGARP